MSRGYGKLALIAGIAACVYASGMRLHKFVLQYIPVGKPGDCLLITYPDQSIVVKVSHNNMDTKTTDVLTPMGENMYVFDRYSYLDLRDLNAKVVKCEEK